MASVNTADYTTNAVSRLGQSNLSGDALALFLKVNAEMVLEAWEQVGVFQNFVTTKVIPYGKEASFPIIGRKRDAAYHTPGELLTGGRVPHAEKIISVDGVLADDVFVAEIDELMNHFDVQQAYSRQIGESLALRFDAFSAQTAVLAARDNTPEITGLPVGRVFNNPNTVTDSDTLVRLAFRSAEHIANNDIGGGTPTIFLRPAQYLLLAQNTKLLYKDFDGSASMRKGTVAEVAGMEVQQVRGNRIPSTNLSADATIPAKYRGDFTNTVAIVANPMAVGCLKVRGFKLDVIQQPDRFGYLMIGSQVQGLGVLRQECAIEWTSAAGTD